MFNNNNNNVQLTLFSASNEVLVSISDYQQLAIMVNIAQTLGGRLSPRDPGHEDEGDDGEASRDQQSV